jgi:hypothetical protein
MAAPPGIAEPLYHTLFVWHLADTIAHSTPTQSRAWIATAPPAVQQDCDPHATDTHLIQRWWAHVGDPVHQAWWAAHWQYALTRAWPTDPPSWATWLTTNPAEFPLLWQAVFVGWRIPSSPGVRCWWQAHAPAIQRALCAWEVSVTDPAIRRALATAHPSPAVTVLRAALADARQAQATAEANLQAVLSTPFPPTSAIDSPEAHVPSESPTAVDDRLPLHGVRVAIIGLYPRRDRYRRILTTLGATCAGFWEGMDDQVPRHIAADLIVFDATHVHHSTMHRIIQPQEQLLLTDPSSRGFRHALLTWAAQAHPSKGADPSCPVQL